MVQRPLAPGLTLAPVAEPPLALVSKQAPEPGRASGRRRTGQAALRAAPGVWQELPLQAVESALRSPGAVELSSSVAPAVAA